MDFRTGLAATVFLALSIVSSAASASAQTTSPPDVVRLHDGTFLRGTIVERSPARVVVMLPTGETRTYPADQVEFAGPDVPAGPALVRQPLPAPVVAPREPVARLHVRSSQPELSLQRLQGTATVTVWTGRTTGTAQVDQFGIVCNAPCDVELPEGTYQLGIAQGTGSPQRAGRPIDLRGDMTLDLAYDDRSGLRIAGWLTFGFGAAAGGALVVASLFAGPTHCPFSGYCYQDMSVEMMVAGSVIVGASMITGLVLAFMNDAATIGVGADGVRF